MEKLEEAWKIVSENIAQTQKKYKEDYDESKKAKRKHLRLWQLVLKQADHRKKIDEHKFGPLFQGPYRVIQIEEPNVWIKELSEEAYPFLVHANKLKPFQEEYVIPWRPLVDTRPTRKLNDEERIHRYDSEDQFELYNEDPDFDSIYDMRRAGREAQESQQQRRQPPRRQPQRKAKMNKNYKEASTSEESDLEL